MTGIRSFLRKLHNTVIPSTDTDCVSAIFSDDLVYVCHQERSLVSSTPGDKCDELLLLEVCPSQARSVPPVTVSSTLPT